MKEMRKNKSALSLITFVMAILSSSSLIFIIIAIHTYETQLFLEKGRLSLAGVIVFVCFALVFLFLIVSFLWQIARIRRLNRTSVGKTALLIFGVLCLFLFIGEKIMIDEIGREMNLGWETSGETVILTIMLALHLVYTMTILYLLAKGSERESEIDKDHPIQEESVFTIAQIIGIACGLIGLWVNFDFFLKQHQIGKPVILFPFYILLLLPYGLVILYWISMRWGVPYSQWYDEKQWRDVASAGLIALLLSVPGMAGLFLFKKPIGFFWFPHYIFLILTLFSASTLYLFRNPE